jgi:hypothetical protein
MKLYRITGNSDTQSVIWAGSQSDAAKARKELLAQGFKRAEMLTEEVEVPTGKAGLLEFLNGLES